MAAINIDQVTEELRLLKGIPKADQEQDDLLTLIVRLRQSILGLST